MIRDIDLNRIADFLKIVELGNITRAAEALGEPKAKLSRNLALLEQDLGVQLVFRTTRQFRLTEMGLQFYKETQNQMQELESSILNLQKQDESIAGKVKITAPEDLGHHVITPIISEYKKIHSKVEIEIIYTNEMLDLVKLGIDIAFRIGNLKDSSLIHKKVGMIEFAIVAATGYLEKQSKIEKPEDLINHQIVGFSGSDSHIWKLTSQNTSKKIRLNPKTIANNYTSVLDWTLLGHGVSFVPRFLAEKSLQEGKLIHILKNWNNKGIPVQAVMPQQKNVPARVRKCFDYTTDRISTIL